MNREQYLEEFEYELRKMFVTTRGKNGDYASHENPFKNFELIEHLSNGKITTVEGILTRMADKIQRVTNLLEAQEVLTPVGEESVDDNLLDLAVYSIILRIYRKHVARKGVQNDEIQECQPTIRSERSPRVVQEELQTLRAGRS